MSESAVADDSGRAAERLSQQPPHAFFFQERKLLVTWGTGFRVWHGFGRLKFSVGAWRTDVARNNLVSCLLGAKLWAT